MASAPPWYASHRLALPCSPLITRKREKSRGVLIDASYQSRAWAVVLPKCTTPQEHMEASGLYPVFHRALVLPRCCWRRQFVLQSPALPVMILCWNSVLDTVPQQSQPFLVHLSGNVSFCVQLMGVWSSDTGSICNGIYKLHFWFSLRVLQHDGCWFITYIVCCKGAITCSQRRFL